MEEYEQKVRKIVAYNDVDTALSSMHARAYRQTRKIAREVVSSYDSGEDFGGASVGVVFENMRKARRLSDAIDEFSDYSPTAGRELKRLISVNRFGAETHLLYGLGTSGDLTVNEYMHVMKSLGLSEAQASEMYEPILEVSQNLMQQKKGSGLRRILVG